MSDNKNKRGAPDNNLLSFKEKYEVSYAIKQLQKAFPKKPKQKVKKALLEAASENSPSEGREKIMRIARRKLKD